MPVRRARQLPLPSRAGPDAVAVRLLTKWGTYWVFSDVEAEIEVAGIRFQGAFGIWLETQNGEAWHFAVGASTLARGEAGFSGISPSWNGGVVDQTDRHMISDRPAPEGWAAPPDGTAAWVAVDTETYRTGYPVRSTEGNRIVVDRFPLQPVSRFELPSVQCGRHTLE